MKSADFVVYSEKGAQESGSTYGRQVRHRLADVPRKWSCDSLEHPLQLVIPHQALKSDPL